ncbi:MAG: hypothetical protein KAH48_02200, partial [Chlorobi bacterium]|nr:hypothetical protein [Chlorobiota bacterium]
NASSGNIVYVRDSQHINFLNNIFTVENPHPGGDVISLVNTYDVVIGNSEDGNIFYSGGTMIRELNENLARKLSIAYNRFNDFYFSGIILMGSGDPNFTEHDIVVDNNTFTISNPSIYGTLGYGIVSYYGTEITNNTFTGLKTYSSMTDNATAIFVLHSSYNPTWTELTLIDNNTITDCENIHGITAELVPMLQITNNDIRIKSNSSSNSPSAIGLLIDGCGGTSVETYAVIKDNKVRITENGGSMMNVYGLVANQSSLRLFYNDIYVLDEGINVAPHAAAGFFSSYGFVANNWFTARGATGVKLTGNQDLKFFYNAINVNSGMQYAIEVMGGMGMPVGVEGSIDAPPIMLGDITIMRNLIMNQGGGGAALFDINASIGSYQNNFWTDGTYIGATFDYGTIGVVLAQKDGDGVIMNDETILAWETATNTGQMHSSHLVSWAHEVTFEAFDILKPIIIDEDIIYDNALSHIWFGFSSADWRFNTLNNEMQLHGW